MSDIQISRRNALANTLLVGGGLLGVAAASNAQSDQAPPTMTVVDTFDNLASTEAIVGQIVTIRCHTLGTIGGGDFIAISEAHAATDGGTHINSASAGIRWKRTNYDVINIQMFGADPTYTVDSTLAIKNAIASLSVIGGKLFVPRGKYLTTSTIYLTKGIFLYGEGHNSASDALRQGCSCIYAAHIGAAIISLKGAVGCTVQDLSLEAGAGAYPTVGLCLGRSSSASAGYHKIRRVSVYGYFTRCMFYSIASEDNLWEDIIGLNYGGSCNHGFVTSTHDIFNVDSLSKGSNLDNVVIRPFIITTANSDSASCIFMETSQQMGSWSFIGGYLTLYRGSYVHISMGNLLEADGSGPLAPLGPFTFCGVSGEAHDATDPNHYELTPTFAFNLSSAIPLKLPGLSITGSRMALTNYGGLRKIIYQAPTVTLVNPNIILPPVEDPTITAELQRNQIIGGVVDVGLSSSWIAATLAAGWSNTYGNPYAAASYSIDGLGRISCRGTVTGGTGEIFTLPVGYRPLFNLWFTTYAGGVIGRILITTSGTVSLSVGNATEVDLSCIQFKP